MVIDANVVLRFLLRDNAQAYTKAEALLESGNKFVITDVTIMEIVYVLIGQYDKTRLQVAEVMKIFIVQDFIDYPSGLAQDYLNLYSIENLDLADCYLIYLALGTGNDLATFDKKMLKIYNKLRP